MMPLNLFGLQLMEAFGHRNRTLVRVGVSVLMALPFIFFNMPGNVKSSGIVMVVLFTTFFGTAISHSRLCEDGRFGRLMVLPTPKALLWLDMILSAAVCRILPALIVLGGFIILNSAAVSLGSLIYIFALLCGSVVLLVILAMLTGHFAGNNGQVHLFSALICGFIAFFSGVIPAVQKLSWLTGLMASNPLHQFQNALINLSSGMTDVPPSKLIVSSVMLGLFCLAIAQRWISGIGHSNIKKIDKHSPAT